MNRSRAIATANARTRRLHGRLGQTRVANLFKPEEGPHNSVARNQKKFREEELAKLSSVVEGSKAAEGILQRLRKTIQDSIAAAKLKGSSVVKLEISLGLATMFVRVLGFAIGVFLFIGYWGVNLFVGFFSGGTVVMGNTPQSITKLINPNDVDEWR
uniref:Uncharacterized protein n=1 Tax=viral metagenome TaxID=1070528 RepID=A0A6C0L085_9ZZZZ